MRIPLNSIPFLVATFPTLGAGGAAYAAQSDSQTRQADFFTIVFFLVFAVLTLLICVWAGRRATSSSEYLTAGSSISAGQNGLAIAGDYMSAGAFLGLSGAIYASGLDGSRKLFGQLAHRLVSCRRTAPPPGEVFVRRRIDS
jgi:cation/acetate symporter